MSDIKKINDVMSNDLKDISPFEAENKKMLDYIYKSPYLSKVYELGINDEMIKKNISKIYDYLYDLEYCSNCPGTNKCSKEEPLIITNLEVHDQFIKRQISDCKAMVRYFSFMSNYIYRDFPDEWLNSTLNKSSLSNMPKKEAFIKYQNYLLNKSFDWIYISGAISTGRSYFASLICNDFISRKKGQVAFINCTKQFKEIIDINDKEIRQKRISELSRIPLLVLDEFGNEFKSDLIRDTLIIPLISYRANHHLFTIIISDFSMDDIVTLYTTNKSSGLRAKQLYNLIKGACKDEISFGNLSIY